MLDLCDNKIELLPDTIKEIEYLERLNLKNNSIINLPSNLCCLLHLKDLRLEGNPIKTVRNDILKSGTSRILRLLRERNNCSSKSCKIQNIPEVMVPDKFNMRKEKRLNLHAKELVEIPDLSKLVLDAKESEVTFLDLSQNKLKNFAVEFIVLKDQLAELNLSSNYFESLPSHLEYFHQLIYLNVSHNSIYCIPKELQSLKNLRELDISFNK